MNSKTEFSLVKSIVQSGQSIEQWDSLRKGKGIWPVEKEARKQFRLRSLHELKVLMKLCNTETKGKCTQFFVFHFISI